MTIIQSRGFVYRIFNFEIYSLVIIVAILVSKAVLLDIIIPAAGLIKPIVELPIAEPIPTSFSVIIIILFFNLNFYTSSYNIRYQF